VAAVAASGIVLVVPATATLARNLRLSTPLRVALIRRFFMGIPLVMAAPPSCRRAV
jgi:hypothetical protein